VNSVGLSIKVLPESRTWQLLICHSNVTCGIVHNGFDFDEILYWKRLLTSRFECDMIWPFVFKGIYFVAERSVNSCSSEGKIYTLHITFLSKNSVTFHFGIKCAHVYMEEHMSFLSFQVLKLWQQYNRAFQTSLIWQYVACFFGSSRTTLQYHILGEWTPQFQSCFHCFINNSSVVVDD
jgi:hypothetical protein